MIQALKLLVCYLNCVKSRLVLDTSGHVDIFCQMIGLWYFTVQKAENCICCETELQDYTQKLKTSVFLWLLPTYCLSIKVVQAHFNQESEQEYEDVTYNK